MKKLLCLMLVFLLLPSAAFAEFYDEQILFRGINWGSNIETAQKGLPKKYSMRGVEEYEYWYTVDCWIFDTMYASATERANGILGCRQRISSSDLDGMQVAGYDITSIELYYAYIPGEDGLLTHKEKDTALIYAEYTISPKDTDSAFADLTEKLIGLYGDVDGWRKETSSISHEMNLWGGANGTMVSLVREDYSSGSHYIRIKYGFALANEYLKKAYDAVVLEEKLNATNNVDGL